VPALSLTGTDGLADGIVGAMMGGLARAALQRRPAGFSENFVGGQELDELENVLALICLLVFKLAPRYRAEPGRFKNRFSEPTSIVVGSRRVRTSESVPLIA